MLSTFIIALREGLEAALIVGILVAYLVRTERSNLLKALWSGVFAALAVSLGLGATLTFTSAKLTDRAEQLFAGVTSVVAVALVTWMVFWMKRTARYLKAELHDKVDIAILGGPLGLAVVSFFAVAREGLETSLFLYSNFQTVGVISSATFGLLLGLSLAVALGYLIYKQAIKVNLSKFFTVTGVALIVVAAGVLSYGVHEFQELGLIPGAENFIWDVTPWIAKDSLLAATLGGTIGFDTTTSWWQLAIWAGYLIAVLLPYLAPAAKKSSVGVPVSATRG